VNVWPIQIERVDEIGQPVCVGFPTEISDSIGWDRAVPIGLPRGVDASN